MGLGGDEMRATTGVYIKRCIHHVLWPSVQLPLPQHLFSCLSLSVPSPLRYLPTHPLQVFVACRQGGLLALRCYSLLGPLRGVLE